MFIALTRAVPSSINNGERTHVDRVPIDLDRAREQHRAYEEALGCRIKVCNTMMRTLDDKRRLAHDAAELAFALAMESVE